MISIIKDFDNAIYIKDALEVVSNDTFLQSRILISNLKNKKFDGDLIVIVKNAKYEYGYYDLRHLKGFVKFEEINLVKTLENRLDIELLGVSSGDILSTGIDKNIELFINNYNARYSYFENIIMYNFNIVNMNFTENVDSYINFILKNIEKVQEMKKNKNKALQYLKIEGENVSNREDFLWFLEVLDYVTDADDYVKVIIFNELFKNYKEFEKETIGKPKRYKDTCFIIENKIFEELLCTHKEYIDQLNLTLAKKEKQLYLFSSLKDDMLNKFIERSTGVLRYEFDYAITYIIDKILDTDVGNIAMLEAFVYGLEYKFEKLIKMDVEVKKINIALKSLIVKVKILSTMEKEVEGLKMIDEWADFYINKYMIVKNDVDKENNIQSIIDSIVDDKISNTKIKNRINSILDNINRQYEEFLYKNFEQIHSQDKGKYSISTVLSKISHYSNEKIIFLVVDAMKWDIWEIAKSIFEEYGYIQKNDDIFLVSMIPTVTSISRLSLFSGNKYKTIIEEKMNKVYDFDYRDEGKHLKRFFKGKKVGFAIGGKERFNSLIEKGYDIYSFIYSESDAVLHGLTDLNKEIIYYILKEQLDNIIRRVESKFEEKVTIVITTDHGTVDIKNSKGIFLEKNIKKYLENFSIDYSNHGKYIRVFSKENIDINIYNEMLEYFNDQNCFHIITRKDMDKFLLPIEENNEHNLFYLICKYNYHISSTTSSNTHGGFSMSETIIPFGVFEKLIEDIKELDITIFSQLVYDTNSKLIVKIFNPNNFGIKNIHLSIKPFVYDYNVDFVGKKGYSEFEINVIPKVQGVTSTNINVQFCKFGKEAKIVKNIEIEVKEDLKTRISKDVKNSRKLDF